MPDLIEESKSLIPAFVFSLLQYGLWLKYRKKMQPHMNMSMEKKSILYSFISFILFYLIIAFSYNHGYSFFYASPKKKRKLQVVVIS